MSHPMIKVEHLSKQYQIGADRTYKTLQDSITGAFKSPLSLFRRNNNNNFWALKDVSFEVEEGEVVGIIGRNGAGKSTLLKILSRITEPTEGRITMRGRVGSLLEVGTGFHPELTGRENIYLNGSILGMKKREIDAKFDEIVKFAEIEKFLDTPVKRYSSGMYVRLAFAVAAHLEPEILLVDEVLAVGDAAFQKKCLGKMKDVSSKEGRTVIFVSHNMGAIASLTKNCIYLHAGQIRFFDETVCVVEKYLSDTLEHRNDSTHNLDYYRRGCYSESPVKITKIWANEVSKELSTVEMGSTITVFIEVEAKKEIINANLTLTLKDVQGHSVVVFFSPDQDFLLSLSQMRHLVQVEIDELPLVPGKYFVDVGINQSTETVAYDVILDYPLFEVVNRGQVVHFLNRAWGNIHWNNVEWKLAM